MRVVLVRHAESIKNVEDRHGNSREDWPLTTAGLHNTQVFAVILSEFVKIEALYCSDSRYCLQTASIIGQAQGVEPRLDPRLRSIDFGVISGLSMEEIRTKFPEIMTQVKAYHAGRLHPKDYDIPRAEPSSEFELRIRQALVQIATTRLNQVCVVAHRSTITMSLNILLNWPRTTSKGQYQVFELSPLSVSLLKVDNQYLEGSIQAVGLDIHDSFLHKKLG